MRFIVASPASLVGPSVKVRQGHVRLSAEIPWKPLKVMEVQCYI
jgi:hypothetical protein